MPAPPPDELAEAADNLTEALTAAEVLITRPDADGTTSVTGSAAESRPPWNAQAAGVVLNAHYGIRRLERELRLMVSGTVLARGSSDGNTAAALSAIVNLCAALPGDAAAQAVRDLNGWAHAGQRLPGVGQAARWLPIRPQRGMVPPLCPYCETPNLRLAEGAYVVACFHYDCPGRDQGSRAVARLDVARVPPHEPVLVWPDGTVQAAR